MSLPRKNGWFPIIFAPIATTVLIAIITVGWNDHSEFKIVQERQNSVLKVQIEDKANIAEINKNINQIKLDVQECKILMKQHMKNEVTLLNFNGNKDIK